MLVKFSKSWDQPGQKQSLFSCLPSSLETMVSSQVEELEKGRGLFRVGPNSAAGYSIILN